MDARCWHLDCAQAAPGPADAPWTFWLPGVPGALAWLHDHHLGPGTRLALAGANSPACAALLQAATLRGITLVLLNRRLSVAELTEQLGRSACRALATTDGHALSRAGLAGTLLLPESFPLQAAHPAPTPLGGQDAALVVFSSGTTGPAKAVRLSLAALRHAARAAIDRLALTPDDHWLGCLPLDHIGGASLIYRAGLSGHAIHLVDRFDVALVERLLDTVITGASVVPTMLHRLVEARAGRPWAASLRLLLTGGGPLSADLARACAGLGLAPSATYGLTEAASQVCTDAAPGPGEPPGSCGTPLQGMRVRITRADASLCAPGERGTIEIAGESLFSGYEASGALVQVQRPGQWFATGDLGSLDAGGRLFVHGRRDEVINSGGEKIAPDDIERLLERHPQIAEAGVYGLPDAQWGQVVAVLLVARGPVPSDAALTRWMEEFLSGFKRPRSWRWVDSLPRTATGKLQRHRLSGWGGGS